MLVLEYISIQSSDMCKAIVKVLYTNLFNDFFIVLLLYLLTRKQERNAFTETMIMLNKSPKLFNLESFLHFVQQNPRFPVIMNFTSI